MYLQKKILSILSLYLSKESPAFNGLIQQVQKIPDEKFTEPFNEQLSSITQRVMLLLDEIIYFVNEHSQVERYDPSHSEIFTVYDRIP
jgi:hypothetical protein